VRAAVITRAGGPEVLEVRDVPRPEPQGGDVLVRVRGSALNRADIMQRQGRYPAPAGAPANIPGIEYAGEIAEVGAGVRRWTPGDRVFGIVGGGGHAEFLLTRESEIARIPDGMSWEAAAAIPEAFITAHDALVTLAAMKKGDVVLIHAVGSGVGLAASQLVKALGGVAVGTARTAEKIERARTLGLTAGAVLRDDLQPLAGHVGHWTEGRGVNVVLDLVGGPYLPASIDVAAPLGRIILIGLLAGRSASINLGAVLSKRLTIRGTVLRARPAAEKAAATEAFVRDVLPLFTKGAIKPVIDRVFPLDAIRDAHVRMESNESFGKIVLTV
jgi:NADPH2:quinone reductase